MQTTCEPSPIQLNITIGAGCFLRIVEHFGTSGWNRWLLSMTAGGHMPLCFDKIVPPVWYWFDFEDAGFSGRNLDGVNLTLAWLRNAGFDGASLVNATIGCCPGASFRAADLRRASFENSDITAADFSEARLDGIKLGQATYDSRFPPRGLPDELLQVCRAEPGNDNSGNGATEFPVPLTGSLTSL